MRAISAPLGVVFAVLIAIVLVLLASFIAFHMASKAVKGQANSLILTSRPYAFYNKSDDSIAKIVVAAENPTGEDINLTGIEIKGSTIYLRRPAKIPPDEEVLLEFYDDIRGGDLRLRLKIIYENGTVRRIWASDGSLADATQGKVSDDVASGYIEFNLITNRGLFKVVARIEVIE